MQTVINEILINYEVFGLKQKNAILIVHGWKRNLRDWENIARQIFHKNKVVLVDLPGMGNSSLPKKQPFDTYDHADVINQFIERLRLQNVTYIGHSFGGKIGMVATPQNSNIKKLLLIDPSGISDRSIATSLKINIYRLLKLFLPKKISLKISTIFSSEDYRNAGNLKESFKKIVSQDVSESAKKIKVPTLIVWGENDKEVSLKSAKILKVIITNSILRIVWRAGHHPHLEKPEKFIEILEEFI